MPVIGRRRSQGADRDDDAQPSVGAFGVGAFGVAPPAHRLDHLSNLRQGVVTDCAIKKSAARWMLRSETGMANSRYVCNPTRSLTCSGLLDGKVRLLAALRPLPNTPVGKGGAERWMSRSEMGICNLRPGNLLAPSHRHYHLIMGAACGGVK